MGILAFFKESIIGITANRLMGRVGTDGSMQEIALGTNLSFDGSTLNADGGSVDESSNYVWTGSHDHTGDVLYSNVTGANYERGYVRFVSNVLTFGFEAGGTGTRRKVAYQGGLAESKYLSRLILDGRNMDFEWSENNGSSWLEMMEFNGSSRILKFNPSHYSNMDIYFYTGQSTVAMLFDASEDKVVVNVPLSCTALPTSDPGVAGDFWNDSGTVKVSAG